MLWKQQIRWRGWLPVRFESPDRRIPAPNRRSVLVRRTPAMAVLSRFHPFVQLRPTLGPPAGPLLMYGLV